MKRFLKKKWHGIPVGIVAVLMALVLVAGSAFAAYDFLTVDVSVDVEEAIAVGTFQTWDNLDPYGSDTGAVWVDVSEGSGTLGDVDIAFGGTEGLPTLTISAEGGYVGHGFTAGEWIVIPVNIRSGSSGELTLSASVIGSSGDLHLDYCWRTNTGAVTETHPDGDFARNFKDDGNWAPLKDWNVTIPGPCGESGSARVGALVLFVRISVPGDTVPGTYDLTITLGRS